MALQASRPMLVTKEFVVRTYDIDFAGHVSNIVFIRWLEDLRFKMLDEYYPLKDQMDQGFAPILTRTNIQYKRAVKLFEPVVGSMWVPGIGAARITLAASFTVNGEVAADVQQEGTFAELDTGRPMRIPDRMRRIVEQ